MKHLRFSKQAKLAIFLIFCMASSCSQALAAGDPLPSWNEGATKKAIIEFVRTVTDSKSQQYVAPALRLATFDLEPNS